MHDIAVLNDIFFSLDTHLSGFFYSRFRTVRNIILIFDDFGADKAFFEVGMDHTGALRGFPSFMESPGTTFVGTGGQECLQVQEFVSGLDQTTPDSSKPISCKNIWRSS